MLSTFIFPKYRVFIRAHRVGVATIPAHVQVTYILLHNLPANKKNGLSVVYSDSLVALLVVRLFQTDYRADNGGSNGCRAETGS